MSPRLPLTALTLLVAFAGGFASSQLLERDAHALAAPFASTLYVPSDGLAFRTFDGRTIARLSYDGHGGVFDVYDNMERPSTGLRAESVLGRPPPPFAVPSPRPKGRVDLGF